MGNTVSGVPTGASRRAKAALRRVIQALATLFALLAAPAAWASCGGQTYTYTVSANSNASYSLNSGQSLRIQFGTYTGNINNFPSNSRICVDSGATFSPSGNINQAAGELQVYGTANIPGISFSGGFKLENFSRTVFMSNVGFNGSVYFNNRANAELIFRQTVALSNGSTLINDGTIVADVELNLDSGTTFTNNYIVQVKQTFNPNGIFNNYGRVHAVRFININANSNSVNYCSWIADWGFNNNSSNTINYGLIYVNWTTASGDNLWQNNQPFRMGKDAIVYGWRFFNQSTINNVDSTGGGRFYMKHPTGTAATEHTKNQNNMTGSSSSNPIIFFDETQSNYNASVPATDAWIFDQPYDQNLVNNTGGSDANKRAAIRNHQKYSNVVRTSFTPPPIDYASPTCSAAIRQVMYDPNPPAITYDYGDAPASYGNPYHQIQSATADVYLGTVKPDWDGGGNNTANADGDDLSGNDDEDGVTLPQINRNTSVTLNIKVNGVNGYLFGWIDLDGNGAFNETTEKFINGVRDTGTGGDADGVAGNGNIRITFTPNAPASTTKSFIRLRWTLQNALTSTANSTSGEIEDYDFTFNVAPEAELPPGGGGGAGGGSTQSSCTSPQTVTIYPRNPASQTSSGTVTNAANATGAISMNGAYASASNSARLGTGGVLTLDMTDSNSNILPAFADITISLTRVTSAGAVQVHTSVNGTTWTAASTSFGAGGFDDFIDGTLKRVVVEAPSGGARYIRITRTGGEFWVDGVSTADICGPIGTASLTVVKSAQAAVSGGFMIPAKDVIYSIIVSNTGTQPADANSIVVIDALPTHIAFRNDTFNGAGTNPIVFSTDDSALTMNYALGTTVNYSNAATAPTSFATCTHSSGTPATGYDASIRYICVKPTGTLNPSKQFTISFKGQIK